jgi:hypothetical protein
MEAARGVHPPQTALLDARAELALDEGHPVGAGVTLDGGAAPDALLHDGGLHAARRQRPRRVGVGADHYEDGHGQQARREKSA